MLTLPSVPTLRDHSEIKRVFRSLSHGHGSSSHSKGLPSPPWSPTRERSHPLSKSVSASSLSKHYSLPWKSQPKGSYVKEAGTSFSYVADLTAELSIASKELHILADGDTFGSGVINIYEDNEDKLVGTDLLVDVRMYYDDPELLKMTDITYVQAANHENGLRIHTATAIRAEAYQRFISINVRIPRSTGSEALKLPAFRTHLPSFTHIIGKLGGVVAFDSISLSSSDKAIFVKSLSARRIRVRTTNGAIEGSFSSDSHIGLRTANAPITADIVLGSDGQSTSNLELISNNAEVTSTVSLDSSAPAGKIPSYRILAKTTNKAARVEVQSSPVDASIQSEVQTSNAPASLHLPSSYQGTFDLHSTPLKPSVTLSDEVKHTSGQVRRRVVNTERERRGLLSGSITWASDSDSVPAVASQSDVSVKTSNAEAHLFV